MQTSLLPIFLFVACACGLAVVLLLVGNVFSPRRSSRVKQMPYESGMDPIHDTRRRFDVRYHLVAIAFLVFDVELLLLYPWAVALRPQAVDTPAVRQAAGSEFEPSGLAALGGQGGAPAAAHTASASTRPPLIFAGGIVFLALLTMGFIYDWKKGIFHWQ